MLIFTIITLFEHFKLQFTAEFLVCRRPGSKQGWRIERAEITQVTRDSVLQNVQEIPDGQIYESGEATIKKKRV